MKQQEDGQVRIAVVTGGSKGLGLAIAKYLATKEGYLTILIARSRAGLDSAMAELDKIGGKAAAYTADISDIADIEDAADKIRAKYGKIDMLVNNACPLHVAELADIRCEDVKKDIETGLSGSILCTKLFLPLMNNGGSILFISSGFGLMGPAGYSIYAAVKAGIINFAESIKRETKKLKINVYAAVPSDIDTPGYRREMEEMPAWMKISRARGDPMPPDMAARRILAKCKGSRMLIFIDRGAQLLYLLTKTLPKNIRDSILDKIFPMPR